MECKICGAPLTGRQRCYCSPECARTAANARQRVQVKKPRPLSPVYTDRHCMDCGKLVHMHIKSKRCPECQREADRKADRESKRRESTGESRKIGTVDACQRCGQPYTVAAGTQKYCPACAPIASAENDRKKSRDLARKKLKNEAYRATRNEKRRNAEYQAAVYTCVICGKPYRPNNARSLTCSEVCAKQYRSQRYKAYWQRRKEQKEEQP